MDKKYQVFVSSTYKDLQNERKAIAQALLECNCIPAGMELFPSSDEKSWDIIKRVIDESDYYLLVIAGKYGSTMKKGKKIVSYTECEYNYALSKNKPILAFIHSDIDNLIAANVERTLAAQNRLKAFQERVKKSGKNVAFWKDASELVSNIKSSINSAIKMIPVSGWIRCEDIGISPGSDFSPYQNVVSEWGVMRVFKTRAEKNAESDPLLETHTIKQIDGIAFGLRAFRNNREKDVLACLENGMNMRLLIMDPKSIYIKKRAQEENIKPKALADSILGLLEWVDRINNSSHNGKIQIKLYDAMTLDFYWRIDDTLYVGPYWYGIDSAQTITYKIVSGSRGFELYSNHFEELWNNSDLSHEP